MSDKKIISPEPIKALKSPPPVKVTNSITFINRTGEQQVKEGSDEVQSD